MIQRDDSGGSSEFRRTRDESRIMSKSDTYPTGFDADSKRGIGEKEREGRSRFNFLLRPKTFRDRKSGTRSAKKRARVMEGRWRGNEGLGANQGTALKNFKVYPLLTLSLIYERSL